MKTKFLALALVLIAAVTPALAQQHPNVQKGFAPERAYQFGEVDNVNVFNGNLVVQIPIGAKYPVGGNLSYNLSLTHNAKLWDYQKVIRTSPTPGTYLRPIPSRRSNAGLGWLLSLGRILLPDNPINDGGQVVYESPDGSEHVIYRTLHEGEPFPPQVQGTNYVQGYTRDGTYLRMRSLANGDAEIEFPDGNVHLFREIGITGLMRPIQLRDRFGNSLNIGYSADSLTWTLTDNHNRKHYVYFKNISGQTQDNYKTAIDRIVLTTFNGAQSTYTFTYQTQSIARACVPTGSTVDPQAPSSSSVPTLQSVRLPTGETWSFDYFTSHNACGQGAIRQLSTPTGARIDYDYQLYRLPAAGCKDDAFNESPGIRTRKITNVATGEAANWQYDTDPQTNYSPTGWTCPAGTIRQYPYAPSEELKNTVTKPNGDRITHYFSIWPERRTSNLGFKRDDYGLPFTRRQTSGSDRFLSTVLSGGGKSTSTYVKYERDGDPDYIDPLAPLNVDTDRRVAASKTVYDDGKYADVAYTNFDGLGNFRVATTSGTFRSGNTRTTTTNYNPGVGEYRVDSSGKAVPGYNPLNHNATWILNTFTTKTTTEGSSTIATEACFDSGTGFLRGRRMMQNASGGANDVVVTYDHVSGNVTSEKYFGGDVSPTSSSGCSASGTSKYELAHTWQAGALKTSKHVGMTYYDVDNDIDVSTGLVSTSRDRADISTTFTYDSLGRLLTSTPQSGAGARTVYDYSTDRTSPTIDIQTKSNDGGRIIDRKFLRFDSLGRPWIEFQLLPTGSWNAKVTRYDTLGRVDRESQRESGNPFGGLPSPANWTYHSYDYLNRDLTITPPDGAAHQITYTYQGISRTTETMRVGDGNSERPVTITREYDRQGRLVSVDEPSGSTGGNVNTTYEYDAADRLRKVTMNGEATQIRTFTYDGRGFLTDEKHPEFDGGSISYSNFDALGHAGRKTGGGGGGNIIIPGLPTPPSGEAYDLSFTYDAGERLTHVRNFGSLVKEFIYAPDNSAGYSKGKLTTAKRYQTVEGAGSVPVTEAYVYSGIGGRVSKKTTTVGSLGSFEQSYTYTDLGQELTIAYPNCLHTGCKETSPSRTITNAYSPNNSWLTAVSGYAPSITYHTNAEINEVQHENGVTDVQGLDPNMIARPASITFKGWSQPPPCAKPAITTQPASTGAPDKATVKLTVVATGSEPLRYQWYIGNPGDTSHPVDGGDEATLAVTITFRQQTYWVQIANACGTLNSAAATVKSCPLVITSQPETRVVAKNAQTSFSVQISGAQGTVTYQWYEGGSGITANPVSGATSSTLTIDKALQDASYWVRVKDSCSTVDSEAGKLIVGSPCLPVITQQPQGGTIAQNDYLVLKVVATSITNDNLQYQWYIGEKGDTSQPISTMIPNQLSARPSRSTRYWVRVSAKCGFVDSESALVCVVPNITTQPGSRTVPPGQIVTLSFQHSYTNAPIAYQWYEGQSGDSSTPLTGETGQSLTVTASFTTFYWARISNDCGHLDTAAAKLCVLPKITKQPSATTREAGSEVTLSVETQGVGITYQWYQGLSGDKARPISGATASTVKVAPSATTSYWVSVSNECGSTNSLTAEVKYCEKPAVTLNPIGASLSPGQSITLKAGFTGTDLTYRWFANGSQLSYGTTDEILVAPAYSTSYTCQASNGCGTATTQPAFVSVCGPPFVMAQPAQYTYVPPGTSGTISIAVAGTYPSFQWYEGVTGDKSKPIANANGSALNVPSRTTSYWVHMTTPCGEASSITAYVKACAAPSFIAQPSAFSITQGQTVTLKVTNIVNGPVTVKWYEGQIVGDTSRFLGSGETIQITPQKTTSYWVRVENGCTAVDQMLNKIEVCIPPRITVEPVHETTITWQQAATLNAQAIGSWAQWHWYEGQLNDRRKEVGYGLYNGNSNLSVVVKPDVDKQYWLSVSNQCGSDGSFVAIVWVRSCGVPTIARQPQSVTTDVGHAVFLSVGASSASSYQWYIGQSGDESKPIAGANFSTLVVSPGSSTAYWVKASNMCGEVNSAAANITIRGSCTLPFITEQPYFAMSTPGVPVKISVGVLSGSANTTYQWYSADGQPVPGATSATSTVSPSVSTTYYCVITNPCGRVTSNNAVVNVSSACIAPTITEQPARDSYTMSGQPVPLSIRTSGTWPLTYQWYNDMPNGGPIFGATERTYNAAPIATGPQQAVFYHVKVSNSCGSVDSWASIVHIEPSCGPPTFSLQPRSATIDPGQSAVLSVAADGPSPINFEWYTTEGVRVPNTYGSTESVAVSPLRTTSYFVIARNLCGFAYSDRVTVTVNASCASPIITESPRSPSIIKGQSVTLNANASGSAPITWQWFNGDGSPIAGATSASYTVTPSTSAAYYAIASNACGTATTGIGLVTVTCNSPSFSQSPQSIMINAGQSTTLTALVNAGSLPATYQWFTSDGTLIPGATGSSITVTPAATTGYYLEATSGCGTVRSATATVTICQPVTIVTQPQDITIDRGQAGSLFVTAQGTGPITYQWYTASGSPLTLYGNDAGLSVGPTSTVSYYVIVKNPCGQVQSRTATITVNCPKPSIITQPQDVTIVQGQSTTLSVVFSTGTSYSAAWYTAAGVKIGEGNQITVTPAVTTGYYVILNNECGPTQSRTATVTVAPCPKPVITQQPQNTTVPAGGSATLTVVATSDYGPLTYQWYTSGGTIVQGATSASLTVTPTYTTSYYVVITNACANSITSNTVTVCSPATIATQPQDVTIDRGQIANLYVVAGGTPPFSYQWYTASGAPITTYGNESGFSVGPTSTVSYYVEVTNGCATARSRTATITVNCPKPAIITQPQSATIQAGYSAPLSVTYSTGTSSSVTWYTSAGVRVGEGVNFAVSPATTTSYYGVIVNECGSTTTNTVTITVTSCAPPLFTQQPQSAIINEGQSVSLTMAANNATSYQWYLGNGTPIAGATANNITVTPAVTTSYYAIATNSCGSTQSATATVTVNPCPKPVITAQPQNTSITSGQTATLTVAASGATAYQWYYADGTAITGATSASMNVSPAATTSYYVIAGNSCGGAQSNTVTVTVSACAAPVITTQPQDTSITAGQTATLTVAATGATSYQWFLSSGTPVSGATSASLSVSPASTTSYYVRVTNACGTTQSNTVTVTVTAGCTSPSITTQPQNATIAAGQSTTLTVAAAGTAPLTYQWFLSNGTPVSGGTSASLAVSPASTTSYYVRVTNSCGNVQSNTVTVTVCTLPAITTQPQNTTINAGQTATLTVAATGATSYQWFFSNGTPVSGGTSASLAVSPASTTSYYVRVTNSCGTVQSNTVTVTVNACNAPSITTQPQNATIAAGQSATLSVAATGTAPLTYQWYLSSGTPISGATSTSVSVSPSSTTSYYVRVTNSCGNVQSNTVTVTICSKPVISAQPQSVSILQGEQTTLRVTASGATAYQWYYGNGTPIAGATASAYTVAPSTTTAYYVVVSNSCGSTTSATATVTVTACNPPNIVSQPASSSIDPGQSATLSVTATGDAPLTYRWYQSNGAFAGNGATISVSPSSTTMYYCVVDNSCGSDTSNFATVTVICNAPSITSDPQSQTINEGQTATLNVSANGTAPLSYTWQQLVGSSWANVGSGSSYNVNGSAGTYTFRAVVSNSCGQDISGSATVTINAPCVPPNITQQPSDPNFTEDWQSATISVSATGTNLQYQWYRDGIWTAGNTPSITIYASMDTHTYHCVVSNGCGTDTSNTITVESVCKPPQTSISVPGTVLSPGQSTVIQVMQSTGSPLLYWTWYEQPVGGSPSVVSSGRGTSVPNQTVIPGSTSDYWVHVSNSCGENDSNVIRLTVQ